MRPRPLVARLLPLLMTVSILLSSVNPSVYAQVPNPIYLPTISNRGGLSTAGPLFRTHVTVATSVQWRDLERMDALVLDYGDDWALVLVDDEQLEDLARWRFNPDRTSAVGTLVSANAASDPPVAESLQPLLAAVEAAQQLTTDDEVAAAAAQDEVWSAVQALSDVQRLFLTAASDPDADSDGLTDTQEGWWCTNPVQLDSDFDGLNDGNEVAKLKAWMQNTLSAPPVSTAQPFNGWPFNDTTCIDNDRDSIPNLAERWDLGLNMNIESTDRDRYDDGQELYGTTFCPGSGSACGYGQLPSANHDGLLLFPQLPGWVTHPGNHPLVAAFPRVEFEIIPDQHGNMFQIRLATVVTTDERHEEGETKSYSTTKTEGTSTANSDTETWETWQEYAKTTEAADAQAISQINPLEADVIINSTQQILQTNNVRTTNVSQQFSEVTNNFIKSSPQGYLAQKGAKVADFALDEACAEVQCKKYTGAGVRATVRTALDIFTSSDNLQNAYMGNGCDLTDLSLKNITCRFKSVGTLWKSTFDQRVDAATQAEQNALGQVGGNAMSGDGSSYFDISKLYPMSFPVTPSFVPTETNTQGSSQGGSHTTTHTRYEEHSVTEGTAKQFGKSWGTATAQDSSHAADLWFAYEIRNSGLDYARTICDLALNVYIGNTSTPSVTYFPGTDFGGDGCLNNFRPGEAHKFTFPSQSRIALTLDQLRAIDLGEPVRIVIEDMSLGQDDFYTDDAVLNNVAISIEDGQSDGNEIIDTYLIPTWDTENVLSVLARFFPSETDDNDMLVAIWTPEYQSTTPAWCREPRRPTDFPSRMVWCKHELSSAEWWNVYTNGLGDSSEGFQDTQAVPGAVTLFRFNKDTDLDGISDRSEVQLGTDPTDASSFPKPELLAGLHNVPNANKVVSTLTLLNTGTHDVYGVEAIMIAPDDSISITNNTVGGSGRVRAQQQFIVGSRVVLQSPLPAPWKQANHAVPAAAGYYTGPDDRTYTFTVQCGTAGGCKIGEGTWNLNWSDGKGNGSSLPFGSGYASPTFVDVGTLGVKIALYSGNVQNGESFTVSARFPRDTFQYTINREPHSEPLVIVSYNDPQGNHRFLLPPASMDLEAPTSNLQTYAGQMLDDVGVELVTIAPFAPGSNNVKLLVNNPSDKALTEAHLFLEFINISGTVVSEVPTPVNVQVGPSYVSVPFNSNGFSPAYNPAQDYIVLAFLTDYQGNILDTAGRPLSSFQVDPLPQLVADEPSLTWNLGTVAQGSVLKHKLGIANTGYGRLYTYLTPSPGLTLGTANQTVGAGDTPSYELTLRTDELTTGPYSATVTLLTSDPNQPSRALHVAGTIVASTGDQPVGPIERPLDVSVTVNGPKRAGDVIEFSHSLGPDAATLHPVKIFNEDYTVLKGVGQYATSFGQGTASYTMFGDGLDGDMVIGPGPSFSFCNHPHAPCTTLTSSANAGQKNVNVANVSSYYVGKEVIVIQMRGTNAGAYEFNTISAVGATSFTLEKNLANTYTVDGTSNVQIIGIPHWRNLTILSGGVLNVGTYGDNGRGGVLVFRVQESLIVEPGGFINVSGAGYRGGNGSTNCVCPSIPSSSGEGTTSGPIFAQRVANSNGGGGSDGSGADSGNGGGGGGNGTSGSEGESGQGSPGLGGNSVGSSEFTQIFLGGGGGGGRGEKNGSGNGGNGGSGGGSLLVFAKDIHVMGSIVADGTNGANANPITDSDGAGGGGGGAGGSILIKGETVDISSSTVRAIGGSGGAGGTSGANPSRSDGGNGGNGRIRIEYCDVLSGVTNPLATTQKLNCYIAEQGAVASDSFGDGRDGVMPSSGNLDNANGFAIGTVNGTVASTNITVVDRQSVARINVGDVVLIHQTRGNGAGNWELNEATSDFTGSGTFTLRQPLKYTYLTNGDSERAQIVRVPQYADCPVTGTVTPLAAWNGDWGGIFAVMCVNGMNVSGHINATGYGYRGGLSYNTSQNQGGPDAQSGESYTGLGPWQTTPHENGGGGGHQNSGGGPGGGGGGHATPGNGGTGVATYGTGGNAVGTPTLSTIYFGGGGGGGGRAYSNPGGTGGAGGGLILIYAPTLEISGNISASGLAGGPGSTNNPPPENQFGNSGGGGGGAGGSIFITGKTIPIGNARLRANGGAGGNNSGGNSGYGGGASVGRIRIEYCESTSGLSEPPAVTQKLNCFIAEQGETGTARFRLPEDVTDERTYQVQFGRKLDFTASGEQVTTLQVPAGIQTNFYLDTLISNVGSGDLTIKLDINGDNIWDWEKTQNVVDAVALTSPNLADAFNSYWANNSMPTSGEMFIPIKVSLSKSGQVLLTNVQVLSAPSKLRSLWLPAGSYGNFQLDFTVGDSGVDPFTVAVDVGNNGSIDWRDSYNEDLPFRITTRDLASYLNSFLNGKSGEVEVPLRIYVSPDMPVTFNDYTATFAAATDLIASGIQPQTSFVQVSVVDSIAVNEGDILPLQATTSNQGSVASGPMTAAFFATAPGWGDWYIGSDFTPNIAAGGSWTPSVDWDTRGFVGTIDVKVVVNPYRRVAETNYTNNRAEVQIRVDPDVPVANFDAAPTSGAAPLNVQFTDRSTGSINTWQWRFGDGGTSTNRSPSHLYTTPGTYSVGLTVSGPSGSDILTRTAYINLAPVAKFDAAPSGGSAPLNVTFTDKSTGVITSRQWNFGNGATSTQQSPSYTFANAGTFNVKLTVTGPGGTDTFSRSIVIGQPSPSIALPATGAYGKINGGDQSHTNEIAYSFTGRTGDVVLSYEAWDIDNSQEVKILLNGVQVGYVPYLATSAAAAETSDDAEPMANEAWTGVHAIILPDNLVNNSGVNILTFDNTSNPPSSALWGIRQVRVESSIALPAPGAYGKISGGDQTHASEIVYGFAGRSGDVLIQYEAWDIDHDREVKILLNGVQVGYVPYVASGAAAAATAETAEDVEPMANEAWTGIHAIILPDSLVNNGGVNMLTFDNISPSSAFWGIRQVRMESNIALPATGAYGNISGGDQSHINEINYSFTGRSGDVMLSYEAWDIDNSREIKILLNGVQVGYVAYQASSTTAAAETAEDIEPMANEAWTGVHTIILPDNLVNNTGVNVITFDQLSNPPSSALWGIRQVKAESTIALPATAAYGKINGGDQSHVNEIVYSFTGRSGNVTLNYEAWDIDYVDEVKILLNGVQVGYVPYQASSAAAATAEDVEPMANDAWTGGHTIILPDNLVNNTGVNVLTFDNTRNPPSSAWWGIRQVSFSQVSAQQTDDIPADRLFLPQMNR